MKIGIVNPNNFTANHYCINKFGSYYTLKKVRTDNSENLGKEPIVLNDKNEIPMLFDGKYYTADISSSTNKYKIFYEDTKKYENGGKEVRIDPIALSKNLIIQERINLGKPLEVPFAKGEIEGVLIKGTKNLPKDKPVIILLNRIEQNLRNIINLPKNVKAIITAECNEGHLTHSASILRDYFPVISAIYDNDKLNKLKKMNGNKVVVNNESGILECKKIQNFTSDRKNKATKISIPQLEHVDRMLDFEELNSKNCGNKGLRLSIMSKLAKDNILKDIIVPEGFILPAGYIEKITETLVDDNGNIDEDKLYSFNSPFSDEIIQKCKEKNINTNKAFIIRSNFNAEDLDSFSSAGIYESSLHFNNGEFLIPDIISVVESKDSKLAVSTRKRYGIPDDIIQPSVIIQEYKHPEFKFTMYTKDSNNNVYIEMTDTNLAVVDPAPAVIIYDLKNKKLSLKNKQNAIAEFWIDEQGKIVEESYEEDKITKQWDVLAPLLSSVVAGGLLLEKVFKAPQDVEGGIKDGKIYFWQTRDIVSKLAKKIK